MRFKDQINFVRQHVKRNRLRVFMTILATAMGCAFLIVLASIAFGLQTSMKKELLSDNAITEIEIYSEDKLDKQKIKAIPNVNALVERAEIMAEGTAKFTLDERSSTPYTQFVDFEQLAKTNEKLAQGTLPKHDNEIVVGYQFAQTLLTKAQQQALDNDDEQTKKEGYSGKLLGKKLTFTYTVDKKNVLTKEMTIVGITKKPSREWDIDERVMMPLSMLATLKTNYEHVTDNKQQDFSYATFRVYASDLEAVKEILATLKAMDLSVYSVTEQLEEINILFTALKAGLIFIGTIAILIASIGIFNTMTMAVTERTREIGVMKAIGTNPKLIQKLFVMESAYIGILGTIIAIVVSYVISIAVNWLIPIALEMATGDKAYREVDLIFSAIPFELVLIASAISISVAIISGWRPARKATNIDVIDALRQ